MDARIAEARDALENARAIVVLTGAGISSESGLPTFREAQTGLWARFRPEDLATPEAFARQPDVVWKWYAWRRSLAAEAEPNAGHHALVELERRTPQFTLVTQNVDGLHERAGSRRVIELHGRVDRTRCSAGCGVVAVSDDSIAVPPRCAECDAYLRPDVTWFGEALPEGTLDAAAVAVSACDVLLVVGTSLRVYPAAGLVPVARSAGATVIRVDAEPGLGVADIDLVGPAAVVLPALL